MSQCLRRHHRRSRFPDPHLLFFPERTTNPHNSYPGPNNRKNKGTSPACHPKVSMAHQITSPDGRLTNTIRNSVRRRPNRHQRPNPIQQSPHAPKPVLIRNHLPEPRTGLIPRHQIPAILPPRAAIHRNNILHYCQHQRRRPLPFLDRADLARRGLVLRAHPP